MNIYQGKLRFCEHEIYSDFNYRNPILNCLAFGKPQMMY